MALLWIMNMLQVDIGSPTLKFTHVILTLGGEKQEEKKIVYV